jgi:hypothetical protein
VSEIGLHDVEAGAIDLPELSSLGQNLELTFGVAWATFRGGMLCDGAGTGTSDCVPLLNGLRGLGC